MVRDQALNDQCETATRERTLYALDHHQVVLDFPAGLRAQHSTSEKPRSCWRAASCAGRRKRSGGFLLVGGKLRFSRVRARIPDARMPRRGAPFAAVAGPTARKAACSTRLPTRARAPTSRRTRITRASSPRCRSACAPTQLERRRRSRIGALAPSPAAKRRLSVDGQADACRFAMGKYGGTWGPHGSMCSECRARASL
jgi:hypothetical protein